MIYKICVFVLRCLAKCLFRVRVAGADHVPLTGPVLICSNHASNLDPPLLGTALTRKVRFMAKAEMFSRSWSNAFLRQLGAFPVRREGVDQAAIRTSLQLLRGGEVVILFPTGERNGRPLTDPRDWRRGISFLAVRAQVPIVPAFIRGPYRLWRAVHVSFGEPVWPPATASVRQAESELVAELVERMRSLVQ